MRGPIARGELGEALCSRRAAATKRRIDQTTVRAARLQARPDTKGGFFGHSISVPFPFGLQDFNGHAQQGFIRQLWKNSKSDWFTFSGSSCCTQWVASGK